MPEFCPTCGLSPALKRRTRYVITEKGRRLLVALKAMEEAMPKCKRCGAPALLGFVDGDKPIGHAPCCHGIRHAILRDGDGYRLEAR